ncbi:hypothetical protein DPSP01_002988 [Paraphaeosphaeria sporulosa]|uniref:FAD-binding FR-type domain-containing protein n=1 Tax=Paraphaeosphaeria sporulosa TaxID=1460663 RepID=A0A177CMZ1_9PLEO|nr:uncharacterized protein CC84DRAFT_1140636 [Paraphaeosphaeria sporulosa]OAG08159.1 hypothetical protein CC84DRAFT_1140636 [Paraphaeosphaeria sporulosa]
MAEDLTAWLREALQSSLNEPTFTISAAGGNNASNPDLPDDPGKAPQFRKLAEAVLRGRQVVSTYNLALIAVLLGLTVWHWGEKVALRKRRRGTRRSKKMDEAVERAWSSSSSTIEGTATPPDALSKKVDETSPLLSTGSAQQVPPGLWKPYYLVKAFMQYQLRPIPIINRAMPTNAVSLFVVAYIALNLTYNFYDMTYEPMYIFSFADRCGLIFAANLPLLYLLAAKNQPLRLLTGYSYESLNIFHRRVGELLCFEAFLHFAGMFIVWYAALRKLGFTLARFIMNRLVILGLLAFLSYQILYFTSLGTFRKRMYEVFLALHIFFQIAGLAFLWFHYHTSRPYVGASLAIFVVDRLIFRLWLKTSTHPAMLTVLDDNETVLVSANWDTSARKSALVPKTMSNGWNPNDHVFLTIPSLSRRHALQAHPFTIFSAAPTLHTDGDGNASHAWFTLLIRAQANDGFTHHLMTYARTHSSTNIRLDGPYGSAHALDVLRASDTAVVIAGGSGIAVAYPLLYALLSPTSISFDIENAANTRIVKLFWVTHEASHRSWIPDDKWAELITWGLEAHVPAATAEAGRPDVPAALQGMVNGGQTGVVVSGPDGLVRDVRNTCARLLSTGANVKLQVEKFGW